MVYLISASSTIWRANAPVAAPTSQIEVRCLFSNIKFLKLLCFSFLVEPYAST